MGQVIINTSLIQPSAAPLNHEKMKWGIRGEIGEFGGEEQDIERCWQLLGARDSQIDGRPLRLRGINIYARIYTRK